MEIQRFLVEIELLRLIYGERVEFDDLARWVYVSQFDLPPGWDRKATELLIEIPPAYPNTAPDGFFIDQRLKTKGGRTPEHYYQDSKYKKQGWAWLCLHIENWKPHSNIVDGDNLLKVAQCIYTQLTELCRSWRSR